MTTLPHALACAFARFYFNAHRQRPVALDGCSPKLRLHYQRTTVVEGRNFYPLIREVNDGVGCNCREILEERQQSAVVTKGGGIIGSRLHSRYANVEVSRYF